MSNSNPYHIECKLSVATTLGDLLDLEAVLRCTKDVDRIGIGPSSIWAAVLAILADCGGLIPNKDGSSLHIKERRIITFNSGNYNSGDVGLFRVEPNQLLIGFAADDFNELDSEGDRYE